MTVFIAETPDRKRLRIRDAVEKAKNGESDVEVEDSDGEESEVGNRQIGDESYEDAENDTCSDADGMQLAFLAEKEDGKTSDTFSGKPFDFREPQMPEVRSNY